MTSFTAPDPAFAERVRASFGRQGAMGPSEARLARVKKPGRTLTVCELEVAAVKSGRETVCAVGMQTLICLAGRPGVPPG